MRYRRRKPVKKITFGSRRMRKMFDDFEDFEIEDCDDMGVPGGAERPADEG